MNRNHIHLPSNVGEVVADKVASGLGSWKFVISMSVFLIAWIALNVVASFKWDLYPFVLLNLCLSFLAGYTGPLVLMSQNRSAARDRLRDDLEAQEVDDLYTINKQQIQELGKLDEIISLLKKG